MLMMLPSLCFAQADSFYKHEAQFTGGLNSQSAFEMELGYSFLFNRYIGVTLGLNMMDQSFERAFCNDIDERSLFQSLLCGCYDDDNWITREQYKKEYAHALLVRPAIRLRLPLFKESGEDVLVFNMETGLYFNLIPNERLTYRNNEYDTPNRYHNTSQSIKNKGGEWLYYHLKSYLSIDMERFRISAGYSFSDFDILNSRRNIVIDGIALRDTLRKMKHTSTVFLALSYCF